MLLSNAIRMFADAPEDSPCLESGAHRPGEQRPDPSWKGRLRVPLPTANGGPAPHSPSPSLGLVTPSLSSSDASRNAISSVRVCLEDFRTATRRPNPARYAMVASAWQGSLGEQWQTSSLPLSVSRQLCLSWGCRERVLAKSFAHSSAESSILILAGFPKVVGPHLELRPM